MNRYAFPVIRVFRIIPKSKWPKTNQQIDYAYAGRIATSLALGQSARMPRYDYEQAEPTGEEITLEPTATRNVVVDGLYASRISLLGECDNTELCHVLMDTPLYVSVLRRIMRDTALVSEVCQRTVRFSPQESLRYMASVAIPTYLQNEDRSSFDFIVK